MNDRSRYSRYSVYGAYGVDSMNFQGGARTLLVFLFALSAGVPALAQDDSALAVEDDPAPVVTRVAFVNSPGSGDTYGPGDWIQARVWFSKPVVVSGEPRLVLRMGDQTRSTDLYRGRRLNEALVTSVSFRYLVKASDRDDDGIGIPANAILLNRGSIRDSRGRDADLTHEAVPDDPERKVNGDLDAVPTITHVFSLWWLRQGDTFGRGESIVVGVQFSERVDITGAPQLTLQVGAQLRWADLHGRRDSILYFEYIVQASDVDANGISVPANALTLNGGSIRDADGHDADLSHDAVPDDPDSKVNGESGVPTVMSLSFVMAPVNGDTYVVDETILFCVQFSRRIHVNGEPQLTLQVGAQARRAEYVPALQAAALLPPVNSFHLPEEQSDVFFKYVVQPSDLDDDGISIPANALTLSGGSIQAVDDNTDARLSHEGLADHPLRKVDGSRSDDQAPVVTVLSIDPPVTGTFGGGDVITVRLRMSEAGMMVSGSPRIALQIGAHTRFATFHEYWGTFNLLFEYVVDESDRDDNGLSIAADAVDLNGGTIRDNAGNDVADLDLQWFAFDDDPNYKVDGGLTPVPVLPWPAFFALGAGLLTAGLVRLRRVGESVRGRQ